MKSITNHLMLFQTCAYTRIRLSLHLSRDNGHDPRFWRRRKGQPSNNGTRICNPQPKKGANLCSNTDSRQQEMEMRIPVSCLHYKGIQPQTQVLPTSNQTADCQLQSLACKYAARPAVALSYSPL